MIEITKQTIIDLDKEMRELVKGIDERRVLAAKQDPLYMIGRKFNRLTAIEYTKKRLYGTPNAYLFKCKCGNEKMIAGSSVKTGSTKSCGCLRGEIIAKDLTGQSFGRLTVIKPSKKRYQGYIVWICKCECGNKTEVKSSHLRFGYTKSCGCLRREKVTKDLTGQVFGRLTVIKSTDKKLNRRVVWLCKCKCGNEKGVSSKLLLSGGTKSCGCFREDIHKKDLKGQVFGMLIVVKPTEKRKRRRVVWLCKCECGNEKEVDTQNLVSGGTKSCGCLRRRLADYDFTGQKFGKLTVIKQSRKRKRRRVIWLCKCECGNKPLVTTQSLVSGTKSCGCAKRRLGLPKEAYEISEHQRYSKYMTDSYIRALIKSSSPEIKIAQSLIDVKRAHLGFSRELRKAKEVVKNE